MPTCVGLCGGAHRDLAVPELLLVVSKRIGTSGALLSRLERLRKRVHGASVALVCAEAAMDLAANAEVSIHCCLEVVIRQKLTQPTT